MSVFKGKAAVLTADMVRFRPPSRTILLLSSVLVFSGLTLGMLPTARPGSFTARLSNARIERLVSRPAREFTLSAVRKGRLYGAMLSETALTLTTAPLNDPTPTPLARLDLRGYLLGQTLLTETDAWALLHPVPPGREGMMGRGGFGMGGPGLAAGSMRILPTRAPEASPGKRPPGEVRRILPRSIARDNRPALLCRIPLDGRPLVTAKINTRRYRLMDLPHVLTPEGVFWMLPHTTTYTQVQGRDYLYEERPPTDDLMLSRAEEAPRLWRSGVSGALLTGPDEALYLQGNLRGGSRTEGRYRLSATDPRAAPIPLPKISSVATPLLFRDRIYWVETNAGADFDTPEPRLTAAPSGQVWSCRPDGSDRTVVWNTRDERGDPAVPLRLMTHADALYLVYGPALPPTAPGEAPRKAQGRSGIVRLYPSRPTRYGEFLPLPRPIAQAMQESEPFGGAGRLSERVRVENGYLYVFVTEFRRGLFDFLSPRSTAYGVRMLYRVPLPE
jgi:hypothetical protein